MAKKLPLLEGEELIFQLEGDVFDAGANPMLQALAKLKAFIMKLLGTKIKATLVVTNQRVIEYREVIQCWCIPAAVDLKVVLPQSVKEVGYTQHTACGCCSFFTLYYESFTQRTAFPIVGGDVDEMNKYVASFYKALQA